MIDLCNKSKVSTSPIKKTDNATQKVENGVVWSSYGSFKVIGSITIRYSTDEFLLIMLFHRCTAAEKTGTANTSTCSNFAFGVMLSYTTKPVHGLQIRPIVHN